VSSGRAAGEAAFIDASATGDDVYFLTGERLVPIDTDTANDIYDARVCQLGTTCPGQIQTPPPCTTVESCRAAPTPAPSIYGTPTSATTTGTGNITPTPTTPKPKPKQTAAQIRAEHLTAALRACRHKHPAHTRHTCETSAHHKYGPKSKKRS
jgi:hypothetical protein